jgi:hypothetical protein
MHGSTTSNATAAGLLQQAAAVIPAAMRLLLHCHMQMSCCRYLIGTAAAALLNNPARMLHCSLSTWIHLNMVAAVMHSSSNTSTA